MSKVYHLSACPFLSGAARAAYRLHEGLRLAGQDSTWLDVGGAPQADGIRRLPPPGRPALPFSQWLGRRGLERSLRQSFARTQTYATLPFGGGSLSQLESLPTPDVWNLHWVGNFLDWEWMLPWLAERAPIVWTLHDLNPLKGVWHYDPLPADQTPECLAVDQKVLAIKEAVLAKIPQSRLVYAAPSRWMQERCAESPATGRFERRHLPYGLDTNCFHAILKTMARELLGLPAGIPVIGFCAHSIRDPRKGMAELLAAIRAIPDSVKLHLATVGVGRADLPDRPQTDFGLVSHDRFLALFYSACDVFVCSSLQDNLPNTVLESMACGTPVVAYRTGGLPDMVRTDVTGKLVESCGDVNELAESLRALLEDSALREKLGQSARSVAASEYPSALQAQRYTDLYAELTAL